MMSTAVFYPNCENVSFSNWTCSATYTFKHQRTLLRASEVLWRGFLATSLQNIYLHSKLRPNGQDENRPGTKERDNHVFEEKGEGILTNNVDWSPFGRGNPSPAGRTPRTHCTHTMSSSSSTAPSPHPTLTVLTHLTALPHQPPLHYPRSLHAYNEQLLLTSPLSKPCANCTHTMSSSFSPAPSPHPMLTVLTQ